jgi:hypothetical protein
MGLTEKLDDLGAELDSFAFRPRTLVSDLVLFALATDVFESAKAVHHTSNSALPHKAYSNARLAFEGAQQSLVLATHEDYETAGALAWVYFESKDANWRAALERKKHAHSSEPTDDQWIEARVTQMSRAWDSVAEGRGSLLFNALNQVRRDRKKKPDNWLHENMTLRQHRAYAVFAARGTSGVPGESAELNQNMYLALCRETHARPRLDSFGIVLDRARGTIRVQLETRSLEQARHAVSAGTELSVAETIAAVRWQRPGAV